MKTSNYEVGDCFEFKDSIKDFGVIFLETIDYPDGKQYNLFPVKLDTSQIGLDRFKGGSVYLTSFPDFTKPSIQTEGFVVYHFLYQKDFEVINKYFKYVGSVELKEEYRNATGGTVASDLADFRTQLNMWDKMFGNNGKMVSVAEVSL